MSESGDRGCYNCGWAKGHYCERPGGNDCGWLNRLYGLGEPTWVDWIPRKSQKSNQPKVLIEATLTINVKTE